MLSKNTIKYLNSLKIKKYRQLHGAFIVEGEKCVTELMHSSFSIISVYCLKSWLNENELLAKQKSANIIVVEEADLQKISDLSTPNKILAVAAIPPTPELDTTVFSGMVIALDGIRDPGNLGTILRTADWFGIKSIVCSPDCVDIYNMKVVQSTMGSLYRVKVVYMDLITLLAMNTDLRPVYGALLEGTLLTEKKILEPGILIIGNESQGISANLLPHISDPIFIPPFSSNYTPFIHAESLNASIANAIICYEICKQLSENKF